MTDRTFVAPIRVDDPVALAVTERAQGDLAHGLRGLLDACVRTRVDAATMVEVAEQVEAMTLRLLESAQDEALGLVPSSDGQMRDHGNPMVGMRNPIAPPLTVTGDGLGTMSADFTLGAAYEGPPGCVHGGMVAAVLDQVVGCAPADIGLPGLTAFLNTTYRRPTLLGQPHRCHAWVDTVEGWKVFARGEIRDAEDRVTAEAEALFIVPRWARAHVGAAQADARTEVAATSPRTP